MTRPLPTGTGVYITLWWRSAILSCSAAWRCSRNLGTGSAVYHFPRKRLSSGRRVHGLLLCRQACAHGAGGAAYAAGQRIRHGSLCPPDCPGRHCRRGGHEPFRLQLVVQALQGDDLLAVCHAVPAGHGLLHVGAFPEIRIGDMLARWFQRCAALCQSVHQGKRRAAGQVQEKQGTRP